MQSEYSIIKVDGRQAQGHFIKVPWHIYDGDPNWVPPLVSDMRKFFDVKNNPFFRENSIDWFIALRGGKPAGRVAAIKNNEHNRFHGGSTGFFGFFEAEDDAKVFDILLRAAEQSLVVRGCTSITGPVNPDMHYTTGCLVDGFDTPPFFMMTYNPSWYGRRFEDAGFVKQKDFYSYFIDKDKFKWNSKHDDISARIEKRYQVTIRTARADRFEHELKIIHELYNDAMTGHWGFTPATWEEFRYMAYDMKNIIRPDLVLIVEYKGEPAGFLLALPNFNEIFIKIRSGRLFPFGIFTFLSGQKNIRTARVITAGISRTYAHLGFGSLLYSRISRNIVAAGMPAAEMSWVVEDNLTMNRAARQLGGYISKTYRVYGKKIC